MLHYKHCEPCHTKTASVTGVNSSKIKAINLVFVP